jgi:WD40 repeat protein
MIYSTSSGVLMSASMYRIPEVGVTSKRRWSASRETTTPATQDSPGLAKLELIQSYEGSPDTLFNVAWSRDGRFLAATVTDRSVAVWSTATGGDPRLAFNRSEGGGIFGWLVWHPTAPILAVSGQDNTVRLWDADAGRSRVLCQLETSPTGLGWSPDGRWLAVGDNKSNLGIWDVGKRDRVQYARVYEKGGVYDPKWLADGQQLLTHNRDTFTVHLGRDIQVVHRVGRIRESDNRIETISVSPAGDCMAYALGNTIIIFSLESGKELAILEGHTGAVLSVQFSPDGEFLASNATDATVRLWRRRDWECVAMQDQSRPKGAWATGGVDFHPQRPILAAKDHATGRINCFQFDYDLLLALGIRPDSRRYVNAKVVLLGDTGVGKSGLGLVLSGQEYQPTDSTHGRNVWTFDTREIEAPAGGRQTREVLLWDLAGQPGYRLVHQLHLNEVAVALLVFDSRSETDPFSGVKHWVRALAQARRLEGDAAIPLRAYLVAARADRGGVAVTKERMRAMLTDLGLDGFFETSAKEGWQVNDLSKAIREGIAWDALPMVSSSTLFDSIKQFLLDEKQQGRLLSAVDDLFRAYQLAQPYATGDGELRASFEACIGRVESRGLIRRLHFGGLVLLQPELLDAYASAMVQAAREEPDGLGYIPEQDALEGRFRLADSERVVDRAQEKLLLIATVEELLRHEIALKEMTDRGMDLVFPSQFTRERPDAPDIHGKQVAFTFEGPLHNIYATLAVRLSHSMLFKRQAMWQSAASYQATVGGVCGIHLRELEEGRGELALFYDERAGAAVRLQFEAYVSEHLEFRAVPGTVTRRRIRACPNCRYVLPDDLIERRLQLGSTTIRCPVCEASVLSLGDDEPPAPAVAAVAEMNRSADARRDQDVAAIRLKGKIETGDYDVFLCHNSKDKEPVRAIGERLRERGILPWLDVWEIPPGTRWQKELARQIKSIRSAAVFIGPKGPGPWQELEVESLLQRLAKGGRPIIPVILEGRQGRPRLPAFLDLWHMVDMRQRDPDPFEQLVWGITGQKQLG